MLKNFLDGMAGVLKLAPTRSYVRGSFEADNAVIASDWRTVGGDMRKSLADVEQEHNGHSEEQRPRVAGISSFYR